MRIGVFLPLILGSALVSGAALAQAGGDAGRGAALFDQCVGCHQIGDGAVNRIGPHLNHIFDRSAGAVEGFRYSDAMRRVAAGGLIWTHQTLDSFLEDPRILVTGTRMSFAGVSDPADRADIIAYLRQYSASPQNIPEAAPTAEAHGHDLDPTILAIVGDPAYGEYLSGECTACHQVSGAADGIPSIVAWPEDLFVIALHAYKDRRRDHQVMQMMASRLSNEEIAALAAYFASLE